MSRMELQELIYMLQKQDPDARILFVEGVSDTAFWERIVPTTERGAVSIYPIDAVEIEGNDGGCRGRAINLARILVDQEIGGRVKFFLDTDENGLVDEDIPENIVFTDFRDLEGYAITEECVSMILFSFGSNRCDSSDLFENCCEISGKIGELRLANSISGLGLPFKSAFVNHPGRVLTRAGGLCTLSVQGLVDRLLQISQSTAEQRAEYNAARGQALALAAAIDRMRLVRGKDFLVILSHCVNESFDFCHSLLTMHLVHSVDTYRNHPNFSQVERFLRQ